MRKSTEMIRNFSGVHEALKQYVPPMRPYRGAYTLERMQKLMDYLGNPQNDYKVIHVAGTSGKTSTCYYVAALLKQAGKKTGMTVSPHIDEINERVQINLEPLPEKKYCKEFIVFLHIVEDSKINPTYFEVLTAFAFWEFKRQACEYVVVEVGLGGLLDATNVVTSVTKLNVITDIGLDHEEILGDTIRRIASQKAGIIKPHSIVVTYEQNEEIMNVIREVADQQQATVHEIWPLKNGELPRKLPLFQRRNWYLAFASYKIIAARDNLPELTEIQLSHSTEINVPARMQKYISDKSTLIIDGSHNQQKLEVLVRSIKYAYPGQKFDVLTSFVSTKQSKIIYCLQALLPICNKLFITEYTTQNKEKTSVDPLKIVDACEKLGHINWEVINDPVKAFRKLQKSENSFKLVTGSFYLLNYIRPQLTADRMTTESYGV